MLQPYDRTLTLRLLRHIGFDAPLGRPSPEGLRALHRAFLARVPYENLEIQLGRPTSIHPVESAEHILTGRGGYCYHLNGTFATLLASLGYDVTTIEANPHFDNPDSWGWHAVALVRFSETTFVADVGLGDGFIDPIELREHTDRQDPFIYALERQGSDTWRFRHDPRGTVDGFDMRLQPRPLAAFHAKHEWQSTSPESSFVRKLTVQSRRADHVLILRSCVLTRLDADGKHSTDIDGAAEWWDIIQGEFGLHLPQIDSATREALWSRVRAAHLSWVDAGRP